MDNYAKLPGTLLPWYQANARDLPWRADNDPYHVWLSETMLQQTRAEVVCGYYPRFLAVLPDISALAGADEELLYKLWEGLGYYSRVRNLQKAARIICENHGGRFPENFAAIRALPGVGPYTAGAVASICFGQRRAAVDGNVLRIISRITGFDAPIDSPAVRRAFAENLERVYPEGHTGDFTQALMELGATVCMPRSPRCPECPARGFCLALARDWVSRLPVRLPKREKRVEEKTVFLLRCEGAIALCRRTGPGVLSGMWQLPNVDGILSPEQALGWAEENGVRPADLLSECARIHVFTHIRWEMRCYRIACRCRAPEFTWCTAEDLRTVYALPTAFRQFLEDDL